MATTQVSKQQSGKIATLREMIDKSKSQIQAALPRHMDADRLARVAMTSIQKTPELLNCTPVSVVRSVIEAAQLGLEPDGVLGHAYLVPYKKNCTLIVGYKGMISLAYRSGMVLSISGQVVYEKDKFEVAFGIEERLNHKPDFSLKDRGKPVCVYAVAHMKDGGHAFVVLSIYEVEQHRKRSASPNSPAWKNDFAAMAVKTAVRQLAKWLPQCPELQREVGKEDALEAGETPEPVIDITESQEGPKKTQSRSEETLRKMRGDGDDPAPNAEDGGREPGDDDEDGEIPEPTGDDNPPEDEDDEGGV